MIEKVIVRPDRIRKINGTFCFIEHRFIREGFFYTLTHHEILLYLFLVLVADRNGLSFYGYDKVCTGQVKTDTRYQAAFSRFVRSYSIGLR